MYAVEAEYIDAVVKKYGPGSVWWDCQTRLATHSFSQIATKMGAIVGGQVYQKD